MGHLLAKWPLEGPLRAFKGHIRTQGFPVNTTKIAECEAYIRTYKPVAEALLKSPNEKLKESGQQLMNMVTTCEGMLKQAQAA